MTIRLLTSSFSTVPQVRVIALSLSMLSDEVAKNIHWPAQSFKPNHPHDIFVLLHPCLRGPLKTRASLTLRLLIRSQRRTKPVNVIDTTARSPTCLPSDQVQHLTVSPGSFNNTVDMGPESARAFSLVASRVGSEYGRALVELLQHYLEPLSGSRKSEVSWTHPTGRRTQEIFVFPVLETISVVVSRHGSDK